MTKYSTIVSAVATKLNTLTGFKQSRFPFQFFGRTTNPLMHLGYSIGVNSTSEHGNRQRTSGAGVEVITILSVVFAFRLRPTEAYPTDYKNALDKEEEVLLKLIGSYQTEAPKMQILFKSAAREIPNSLEYSIHTIELDVLHYIS